MSNASILYCRNLHKTFQDGRNLNSVLKAINFDLHLGERVAIIGSSGSGKSTLLHILGGLAKPDSGEIHLLNYPLAQLNENKLCYVRNHYLGFIYQFHHLLSDFTVLENVCMPLLIRGKSFKAAKNIAYPLLDKIGLLERKHYKPSEISGGEKQRTAIARAAITQPNCILADEPTGNLDAHTAHQVLDALLELNETSLVMVTHDMQIAKRMDRILYLQNGVLMPFSEKEKH